MCHLGIKPKRPLSVGCRMCSEGPRRCPEVTAAVAAGFARLRVLSMRCFQKRLSILLFNQAFDLATGLPFMPTMPIAADDDASRTARVATCIW